jgi:60 kDa SS-A/Ro ribonucleoprotein
MAAINKKSEDKRFSKEVRLAGDFGQRAAIQDAEAQLRRCVLANLLWEDTFYQDGKSVVEYIKELIPQVDPSLVAGLAIEARTKQKLRHIPLLLVREMARIPSHRHVVGDVLPQIIKRADELSEFLALYWKDGKTPISNQVKKGLAAAFNNFDAYQLAKYNRDREIKLRDVMFMVHPDPTKNMTHGRQFKNNDFNRADLYKQLAENELPTPDTWEVALSSGADKKATWERLILEGRLGALAFMRNLRNMEQAKVESEVIRRGFETIKPTWLLPLNFFAAIQHAPRWQREIENWMFQSFNAVPKLPGYTIFVVDRSGSMNQSVSAKSTFSRQDAANAMAVLAMELCERVSIYATGGNDRTCVHATELLRPHRGFALVDQIKNAHVGGGGIFTYQCLEYIREQERDTPDRIIVFSDSQDCDHSNKRVPRPFGKNNYIVDVSSHTHGINYKGVWTAEISGWSERFLEYIAAYEGIELPNQED